MKAGAFLLDVVAEVAETIRNAAACEPSCHRGSGGGCSLRNPSLRGSA